METHAGFEFTGVEPVVIVDPERMPRGADEFGGFRRDLHEFHRRPDGRLEHRLERDFAGLDVLGQYAVAEPDFLDRLGTVLGNDGSARGEATASTNHCCTFRSANDSSLSINCLLAVFNLLPIPPLDGGRVLTSLLPSGRMEALRLLEGVGYVVVLVVLLNTSIVDRLVRPVIAFFLPLAG